VDQAFGPGLDALEQIVGDIFVGLLAEDALPYASDSDVPIEYTAAVSVVGGWAGHVVVACSSNVARRVSARLLLIQEDEVTDEDIADAIGEFANVVGGNVKSIMPGPSSLSLPRVMRGPSNEMFPGATEVCRLELVWHSEPLVVSIWAAPSGS
jgi:chemotaxis protein CheX